MMIKISLVVFLISCNHDLDKKKINNKPLDISNKKTIFIEENIPQASVWSPFFKKKDHKINSLSKPEIHEESSDTRAKNIEDDLNKLQMSELDKIAMGSGPKSISACFILIEKLLKKYATKKSLKYLSKIEKSIKHGNMFEKSIKTKYKYFLSYYHLFSDQPRKARKILRQLIIEDEKNPNFYIALVETYFLYGKFSIVDNILQSAIKKGISHPTIYNFFGLVEDIKGNIPKAEKYFKKALSLDKKNEQTTINLALHFLKQNKISEMDDLLDDVSISEANLSLIQAFRFSKQGFFDRAIAIYENRVEENPRDAVARYYLARSKFLNDQNDPDVGHLLRETMELRPKGSYLYQLAYEQSLYRKNLGYD